MIRFPIPPTNGSGSLAHAEPIFFVAGKAPSPKSAARSISGIMKSLMTWGRWLVFQSPDTQAWQNDYLQGTGCEMYTETLSPSFTGMTFPQASE